MASYYLNSNAPGADDGSSVFDAWQTIERPIMGSADWAGTAGSGGPVNGAGDVIHIANGHDEDWVNAVVHNVRFGGAGGGAVGSRSNPVHYLNDYDGSIFGDYGTRPIIRTYNSTLAHFDADTSDIYVIFEGIDFVLRLDNNANAPNYLFEANDPVHLKFIDCNFDTYKGLCYITLSGVAEFQDCDANFSGFNSGAGGSNGIAMSGGHLKIRGGTYDTIGSNRGIWMGTNRGNTVELEECIFQNNGLRDIKVDGLFNCLGRDVQLLSGSAVSDMDTASVHSRVVIQDYDDNPRLFKAWYQMGTLEGTEAGDLHTGGADSAIEVTPNVNCTDYTPLKLFEIPVWAPNGVSQNYEMFFWSDNWTAQPAADELYFEVGYYGSNGSSSRTWTASTETISTDETWTSFTVSNITPSEDGWVILRGWLKVYEAGGSTRIVRVDPKPVVTR